MWDIPSLNSKLFLARNAYAAGPLTWNSKVLQVLINGADRQSSYQ